MVIDIYPCNRQTPKGYYQVQSGQLSRLGMLPLSIEQSAHRLFLLILGSWDWSRREDLHSFFSLGNER